MTLLLLGETWGLYDTATNSWVSEGNRIFFFNDVAIEDRVVPAKTCAMVAASLLDICSCEKCKGRIIHRQYDETIVGLLDIKSPDLWRQLIDIYLDAHRAESK